MQVINNIKIHSLKYLNKYTLNMLGMKINIGANENVDLGIYNDHILNKNNMI